MPLALQQGLAAVVRSGLEGWEADVPPDAWSRLRAASIGASLRTELQLEPTLRRALLVLREAGVEAVAMKGASLAYTAYPNPSYRGMGDIDLLVREPDLERARSALQGAGFVGNLEEPDADHHLRSQSFGAVSPVPVELHHRLLPNKVPYFIDTEGVWSRSRAGEVGGVQAKVLSPEDELHLACVHLSFAHRYERFPLRGLVDLLAITTRYRGELDWALFLSIVGESRTAGAAYWPLELSRRWLAAPVPDAVISELAPARILRRLIGAVSVPEFIVAGSAPGGNSSRVLYRLMLNVSLFSGCPPFAQIKGLAGSLFPPPDGVGHLSPAVVHSPVGYLTHIASPRRMIRGGVALARLIGLIAGQGADPSGRSSILPQAVPPWRPRTQPPGSLSMEPAQVVEEYNGDG